MKAVVSGGRTGGHLIPGISLYEELKKRNIGCRYVMSAFDLNFPVASRISEEDRFFLPLRNMSRKLSLKTPLYILKILASFFKIFGLFRRYNPDFAVITGGYISNPVALSGVILGKPLYIIEQNSVAGITNRFYSPFSRKVFTSFPETKNVPPQKIVFTGNPSIHHNKLDRLKAREFFQAVNYDPVIGVTSGSQGSRRVNECIIEILPGLLQKNIGIVWSAGSVEYKRMDEAGAIDRLRNDFPNIRIYQFIERMDAFFSAVDCAISRAGASSITESINYELPLLLIPIRNSPDNHQENNALYIEDNGGGIIVREDGLNPSALTASLFKIIDNLPFYRKNMAVLNSKRPPKPEIEIIDRILADYFGMKYF